VSTPTQADVRRTDLEPRTGAPVEVECRLARGAADLLVHHQIRRAVFVAEQRMFAGDDRDERDDEPATLHVLGTVDGRPAGAVRLYPHHPDQPVRARWRGDRLAVLPGDRHTSLGAALVRFAVATAGAAGGDRMDAMIQVPNVRFFLLLGWERDGPVVEFHGRPHQPMAIALTPGRGR
jgi:putative N-acetyltransferase (TIGR04045 family)